MPPYGAFRKIGAEDVRCRIGAFLAFCNKLQERREISPGVPGYRRRGGVMPPYGCRPESVCGREAHSHPEKIFLIFLKKTLDFYVSIC